MHVKHQITNEILRTLEPIKHKYKKVIFDENIILSKSKMPIIKIDSNTEEVEYDYLKQIGKDKQRIQTRIFEYNISIIDSVNNNLKDRLYEFQEEVETLLANNNKLNNLVIHNNLISTAVDINSTEDAILGRVVLIYEVKYQVFENNVSVSI